MSHSTTTLNYKPHPILSGHKKSISSVKFSPDGNLLASAAADKLIKIWDATTGDIVQTIPRGCGMLLGVLSPLAKLRDRSDLGVVEAHSDPVMAISFSHEGTLIVSCAMDAIGDLIRIWDANSGQCLKTLVDDDNPHVFTYIILTKFKICFSVYTRFNHPAMELPKLTLRQNLYGAHERTYSPVVAFSTIVSRSEDAKIYMQSRRIAQILEDVGYSCFQGCFAASCGARHVTGRTTRLPHRPPVHFGMPIDPADTESDCIEYETW